jgi:hypothetical protein
MPYNDDFYRAYEQYLSEPAVRAAHDWIFALARAYPAFDSVVDLGCGQFNEFFVHAKPASYLGIDTTAEPGANGRRVVTGDYRNTPLPALIGDFKPTALVSLFSSEITAPAEENYKLYERIFRELPIQAALVSGFFYANSMNVNPIGETGGILSYQTLESPESVKNDLFTEKRIILPVPSKMFGQDVYEVWKLLERRT